MSDTMQNEARDTAGLINADGQAIEEAAQNAFTQAKAYIVGNPIQSAMIALAVGYVMGRLKLIV